MVRDGNPLERDSAQAYFRTVTGENYSISRYRKELGKGTLKIDATRSPRWIDATPSAPNARPLKGIYEWDGDKLKMIFAGPGAERPRNFKSLPGSGSSYTLWEPEKK
jgi:uncharacterized protein (TIGR03067 family)